MKKFFLTPLLLLAASVGALFPSTAAAEAITDFGENKIVDALIRGQALGAPATWHLALFTDACSDAGPGAEATGGAYARQAVAASLANWAGTQAAASTTASTGTGATTSNNATISFPESTAAWGTLQSVGFMDASTAGNRWICIDLSSPFNVSAAGVTVKFNPAALTFQVDN